MAALCLGSLLMDGKMYVNVCYKLQKRSEVFELPFFFLFFFFELQFYVLLFEYTIFLLCAIFLGQRAIFVVFWSNMHF